MVADIVPVLSAITQVDADEANAEFMETLAATAQGQGGQVNTKAFAEAVMLFRDAHPFGLGGLPPGQKAKEGINDRDAGTT